MKRGVAVEIVAEPAREIYQELKSKWCRFLSPQDMSFRPHYTVQNKVEKEVALKTFKELQKEFKYSRGWVNGVTLWQYDQGSWREGKHFTL
jgi:2'-5' RNA ligase